MIALLLAEGFEEVEAITTADYLDRAGIKVLLTGVGSSLVKGAHGISVKTDVEIDSLPDDLECIILPGGIPGAKNLTNSDKVPAKGAWAIALPPKIHAGSEAPCRFIALLAPDSKRGRPR